MPRKKSNELFAKALSKVNLKYASIIIAVGLFALIGSYFLFFSKAAGPVTTPPATPSIYLAPTSQTLGINTTFTVEVRENSGSTTVNAVQANFTYPTFLVDWVSTNTTTSAFDIKAEETINATTGQINIARGVGSGATVTGDKLIAILTFRTKATGGVANLSLSTGTALVSSATSTNILSGTGSLGNALYTIDTTGPTASISSPANNANVELGSTQNIAASATDSASDVTKVEFYVDGVLKSTDTTSPYSYSWPTTGVTEASHALTVKAYDTYNNVTTSSAINVNVRDATAPTVSITAPTAGSTIAGIANITASASDNTNGKGLNKVEFYVDGVLKSTDTTSPYSYSWDTTTATDANHSITAKAYDSANTPNVTTSSAVSVTVDNSDKTAPTAPANLRTTGNTYTTVALAWNASTDNVAVTGYRLSRNGTVIYNGPALSFNDTGLAQGTSYAYSVVAYDSSNNVSSAATINASTKTQKTGDVNSDDIVNVFDLSILLSKWNTNDSSCDITKDGIVNIFDLSVLLSNWGI